MPNRELIEAFAHHGVGFSERTYPSETGPYPNWDAPEAFMFYDRVALSACACEQFLADVLRGQLGTTTVLSVSEWHRLRSMPAGQAVWVEGSSRKKRRVIMSTVLVMSEEKWLSALSA